MRVTKVKSFYQRGKRERQGKGVSKGEGYEVEGKVRVSVSKGSKGKVCWEVERRWREARKVWHWHGKACDR